MSPVMIGTAVRHYLRCALDLLPTTFSSHRTGFGRYGQVDQLNASAMKQAGHRFHDGPQTHYYTVANYYLLLLF